jgi:hypothetical protein
MIRETIFLYRTPSTPQKSVPRAIPAHGNNTSPDRYSDILKAATFVIWAKASTMKGIIITTNRTAYIQKA